MRYQYYDKGDGIMVVGLDDCMGDWGWIDMSWDEFCGLSDEQKKLWLKRVLCNESD